MHRTTAFNGFILDLNHTTVSFLVFLLVVFLCLKVQISDFLDLTSGNGVLAISSLESCKSFVRLTHLVVRIPLYFI